MNVKKLMSVGLFTLASIALMAFVPSAKADSDNNHNDSRHSKKIKINDIGTTKNSATISFRAKKFKNETVNAIISVKENHNSDSLYEKSVKTKIDENGNGVATVKNLKPGTKYEFKVRIMREGEDKSTKNSKDKSVSTQ